ncbi:MAG: hypothetical protein JO210_04360 [Acidobacteriaceae bacterium]|nr:hypothetical protein [Acidobacteriaceae bacterium]
MENFRRSDLVSGSKSPRQSVEQALDELRYRIKAFNDDSNAVYEISDVVAFGDFLSDAARFQAAEAGIRLMPKKAEESTASAKQHRAE